MRKKFIWPGSIILIFLLIYFALDYSGKVAHDRRYERYKTEPVTVESILDSLLTWQRNDYQVSQISDDESFELHFQKDYIPSDTDHDIDINISEKKVGDTTILIEKAYRSTYPDGDKVTIMVRLVNDTKKLRGQFLLDGYIGKDSVSDPSITLAFYHQNKPIEMSSYGYGTGDTITVSLPISILELYQYQVDVKFKGLALYEYEYRGV